MEPVAVETRVVEAERNVRRRESEKGEKGKYSGTQLISGVWDTPKVEKVGVEGVRKNKLSCEGSWQWSLFKSLDVLPNGFYW